MDIDPLIAFILFEITNRVYGAKYQTTGTTPKRAKGNYTRCPDPMLFMILTEWSLKHNLLCSNHPNKRTAL